MFEFKLYEVYPPFLVIHTQFLSHYHDYLIIM